MKAPSLPARSKAVPEEGFSTSARLPLKPVRAKVEVPAGPVLVICGSGYRSAIAASLLARAGREEIAHVVGGMDAYRSAGLPVAMDEPAVPAEVR